jgi:hypothetical protein
MFVFVRPCDRGAGTRSGVQFATSPCHIWFPRRHHDKFKEKQPQATVDMTDVAAAAAGTAVAAGLPPAPPPCCCRYYDDVMSRYEFNVLKQKHAGTA